MLWRRSRIYVIAVLIFIGAIAVSAFLDPLRPTTASQRAAFKVFVAHLVSVVGTCDHAAHAATLAYNAAGDGGADLLLTAYRSAGAARHTCSTASASVASMRVPDAVSDGKYGLEEMQHDLVMATHIRGTEWEDAQGVLQDTHNLALQSKMLDDLESADSYEKRANTAIRKDAVLLHVRSNTATPTPSGASS